MRHRSVYLRLINSAGSAFVSQFKYLIPLWAVLFGTMLLGEDPQPNHLYALALVLGGLLVTQQERREAARIAPTKTPGSHRYIMNFAFN